MLNSIEGTVQHTIILNFVASEESLRSTSGTVLPSLSVQVKLFSCYLSFQTIFVLKFDGKDKN